MLDRAGFEVVAIDYSSHRRIERAALFWEPSFVRAW